MSGEQIRNAVESVRAYFTQDPSRAVGTDQYARARLGTGFMVTVEGPSGQHLTTDMPKGLGGGASSPTPGWIVRAGIASCTASVIAMRAAELSMHLQDVEVEVDSRSNDMGMLGMDDNICAGPLDTSMRVSITAPGVPREELSKLVDWAVRHSPMADLLGRAVPLKVTVQ